METRLLKLQTEGYSIVDIIFPKIYNGNVNYRIRKQLTEKLKNKKAFILEKDGKYCIITEDD